MIYWCPPHSLKLSAPSCATLKATALEAEAHPRREGSRSILISKKACLRCPGVEALAAFWQLEPTELDTSGIVARRAEHAPSPQPRKLKIRKPKPTGPTIALSEIAARMGLTPSNTLARLRWLHIRSVHGEGKDLLYDRALIDRILGERGQLKQRARQPKVKIRGRS